MPRVECISKTDLSFLFLDFLGKQMRLFLLGRSALSINVVRVQVVEAQVSPAFSWGRTGKTFWEKTRLRLERCNQSYQLSDAGRSIYRGHRVEERFHRMIRDTFFPHLTSYCLESDGAANSSAGNVTVSVHVMVEKSLLCGYMAILHLNWGFI